MSSAATTVFPETTTNVFKADGSINAATASVSRAPAVKNKAPPPIDTRTAGNDDDDDASGSVIGPGAIIGIIIGVLVLLMLLTASRYRRRRGTKDAPKDEAVDDEYAQIDAALGNRPDNRPDNYADVGAVVNPAFEPAPEDYAGVEDVVGDASLYAEGEADGSPKAVWHNNGTYEDIGGSQGNDGTYEDIGDNPATGLPYETPLDDSGGYNVLTDAGGEYAQGKQGYDGSLTSADHYAGLDSGTYEGIDGTQGDGTYDNIGDNHANADYDVAGGGTPGNVYATASQRKGHGHGAATAGTAEYASAANMHVGAEYDVAGADSRVEETMFPVDTGGAVAVETGKKAGRISWFGGKTKKSTKPNKGKKSKGKRGAQQQTTLEGERRDTGGMFTNPLALKSTPVPDNGYLAVGGTPPVARSPTSGYIQVAAEQTTAPIAPGATDSTNHASVTTHGQRPRLGSVYEGFAANEQVQERPTLPGNMYATATNSTLTHKGADYDVACGTVPGHLYESAANTPVSADYDLANGATPDPSHMYESAANTHVGADYELAGGTSPVVMYGTAGTHEGIASIGVQIISRSQAEGRLHEVRTDGGYIVRARSDVDAAAHSLAFSYYARGTIIHHKIVRQTNGAYTMDGKHTHAKWVDLAELLAATKTRAQERRGLAAMEPVAPSVGTRVVDTHAGAGYDEASGAVPGHLYESAANTPDPSHMYESAANTHVGAEYELAGETSPDAMYATAGQGYNTFGARTF